MAAFSRKDWEDLNITREEVENLSQALKKEEFRKLLSEYAEEINDPKNRQKYQEDIIQLESERGIDCTFVNPEPGFVVKTSLDGKKKAFVNICKNKAVGRPNYKREVRDDSRGLSWSIPLCQAPGREDFDKKRNRCVVYDVIFHPDTIHLTQRNQQFKKLVIETALNAVEESFKVNLDKKNYKIPKLNFKGTPFATVIRKKSKNQPVMTEEDAEYYEKIKYPFKPPKEESAVIRTLENRKPDVGKYTVPKYIIKHQTEIDMQEFTYDKNAKINAAIPKQLIIEVNLPLLNSTKTVTLDIMKKSLHLLCEKPAKYKLDIHLPYNVNEETGNAKFDKERRLLIVTLPIIKAQTSIKDLMREDSGVESDLSPVESISNNEIINLDENNLMNDSKESVSVVNEIESEFQNDELEVAVEESKKDRDHRTKKEMEEFLEPDKQYTLPGFSCNVDGKNVCFVLNVKNVDSNSLIKKIVNSHTCHIKFISIGSGFFPIHYAFFFNFKGECNIKDVVCETWDNNVTVLVEFVKNGEAVTKYYVGLSEDSVTEHSLSQTLELKQIMDKIISSQSKEDEDYDDDDDDDDDNIDVNVESANLDEVILSVEPKESGIKFHEKSQNLQSSSSISHESKSYIAEEKCRTLSESGVDIIEDSLPLRRKSILKKRISRSLSESNAEDYIVSSSVDKTISDGSDFCIHEKSEENELEIPYIKKTVRFNEKIRQKLFRVNSSILGRKNKAKKKNRNKKRANGERKLSESENSEIEETKNSKPRKSKHSKKNFLIEVISKKYEEEKKGEKNLASRDSAETEKNENPIRENNEKPKLGLKKDDKIFEFKSDLIFSLDF